MDQPQISDLSVFASGIWPVEVSIGKRVNARHRVAVKAAVDASTGEVRFFVEPAGIQILRADAARAAR